MENLQKNSVFSLIKSVLSALALSLVFAIIFAFVLRFASLPYKAVYPINQVLKGLSLCVGILLYIRGEKGWLKGGACGILFTAVSYLTFSSMGGNFSLSWLFLVELLLTAFIGAVSGSLAVNVRRA